MNYEKQKAFDDKLQKLQLFDINGYGPSLKEFEFKLNNSGLKVRGHNFHKI